MAVSKIERKKNKQDGKKQDYNEDRHNQEQKK